ncbi:MAG: glutamylcysteine synthetase [Ruminococcus sp.]|nr:glutamylcysteine synthetase [Ruminococcus sp.]
MKNNAKELIRRRFIEPTTSPRTNYIGIEIEMPVVPLKGEKTAQSVSAAALKEAARRFGFTETRHDAFGVCHEAVCEETGDVFSFDCSYNNFEISLGKVRTLHEAQARFTDYVSYINTFLKACGHLLTGMGINPFYRKNDTSFVPSPRYQMLEGYLRKSREWERDGGFHPYTAYPTFSSASQVQLDVTEERLCDVIEAFSLVEPIKALLFANSYLPDEPDFLCVRDMLWERSTHGVNPKNLGFFEPLPRTNDEVIDYLSGVSPFCAEREDKYLFFYPIPFEEYLERECVEGEYFDGEKYVKYRFKPSPEDIRTLRTYKQIDLTARGTLEFRSACTQPLCDAMTVAAFHLGLMSQTKALTELLRNDRYLYQGGESPYTLRKRFNRRDALSQEEQSHLRELTTVVLLLAQKGLHERGFSEKRYLEPLFRRAAELTSPAKEMIQQLEKGADIHTVIEQYAKL